MLTLLGSVTDSMERQFAELSAEQALQWAAEEFGDRLAVSTSFGIQSAVTLRLATAVMPAIPVIWVDTGYLPQETYRYAETLTRALRLNLHVYRSPLTPSAMEAQYGKLWESGNVEDLNRYHQIRKVEPMQRALDELQVQGWVAGLRANQTQFRRQLPRIRRVESRYRIYPILSWSDREVYRFMQQHNLPQHPLFDQGYTPSEMHTPVGPRRNLTATIEQPVFRASNKNAVFIFPNLFSATCTLNQMSSKQLPKPKPASTTIVALCLALPVIGCAPTDTADLPQQPGVSRLPSVSPGQAPPPAATGNTTIPDAKAIVFKDDVTSNVEAPTGLDGLVFFDTRGQRVTLEKYLGRKNVVLVFTEGFGGGMLCPFCKTQTSRLVANYERFEQLDAEVLVVYPGARDHLDEFIEAATQTERKQVDRVPFPLVLDEDLSAVGFFKIASNLAHPSTFIIDKGGNVRLAYVGADMSADRPSIAAMLGVLESIQRNSTRSE